MPSTIYILKFDDQGCWALETEPGPLQGAHHDLSKEPDVTVRLDPSGPDVRVSIERIPFVTQCKKHLEGLKAVCVRALKEDALVLTSIY